MSVRIAIIFDKDPKHGTPYSVLCKSSSHMQSSGTFHTSHLLFLPSVEIKGHHTTAEGGWLIFYLVIWLLILKVNDNCWSLRLTLVAYKQEDTGTWDGRGRVSSVPQGVGLLKLAQPFNPWDEWDKRTQFSGPRSLVTEFVPQCNGMRNTGGTTVRWDEKYWWPSLSIWNHRCRVRAKGRPQN